LVEEGKGKIAKMQLLGRRHGWTGTRVGGDWEKILYCVLGCDLDVGFCIFGDDGMDSREEHRGDVVLIPSRVYGMNMSPDVSSVTNKAPPTEGGTLDPGDPECRT
jgi:hypothetical protein